MIRAGRGKQRSGRKPVRTDPLVTVVVATVAQGAADDGLADCLDALHRQEQESLEILVAAADDQPTDQVVQDLVERDPRFRLVTGAFPDVATARNRGADQARGRYLAFLRPQDELPTDALRLLAVSLEESGSEFAFGRLLEVDGVRRDIAGVPHPAHRDDHTGASLETWPEAITDIAEENRLYRTSFWRAAGLAFPATPEAVAPALAALLASTRFDVLAATTCRRARTTPGAEVDVVALARAGLRDWLSATGVVRRVLRAAAPEAVIQKVPEAVTQAVTQAWARAACDVDVVDHLDNAHHLTPDLWEDLRSCLGSVRDLLTPDTWATVRAESRTKVWLAVAGHRRVLEMFVALRQVEGGNRRTAVAGGRVLADFDGLEGVAVPRDCLVLSDGETALSAHLHRMRWRDERRLELTVFAWVPFVDLEEEVPDLEARLVDAAGLASLPVPVTPRPDPQANVVAGHRYQDYAPGAAELLVDVAEVARAWPGGAPTLHVELTLTARGVTRSGGFSSRESRTVPGPLGPVHVPPGAAAGRQVLVRAHAEHQVALGVRAAPEVTLVSGRTSGSTVTGVVLGAARGTVHAVSGDVRVAAASSTVADGTEAFELRLPERAQGHAAGQATEEPWRLMVIDADGGERPVGYPVAARERFLDADADAEVLLARAARGMVEVVPAVPTLLVTGVTADAEAIEIRGRWVGRVPAGWRLSLSSRVTVSAEGAGAGTEVVARLPATVDRWGLGRTCLPPELYLLEAVALPGAPAGAELRADVVIAEQMADELLRFRTTDVLRLALVRSGRGPAVLVQPPLSDDERGPRAQQVLQQEVAAARPPVDEHAVYFQSYTGEVATDSSRALSDELRRTRPDLTLYWGVASCATPVPEGTVPVLMRSREWHRVLGSAAYLVSNIDLNRRFHRRAEQRYLQTFHGYPAKAMGLAVWRSRGFSPSRLDLELAPARDDWTLILTPAPEMDVHYREQYQYTGPIETAGYPRDDALLGVDADEVRSRTRRLLGITEGQTAVLYAPTWRNDEAISFRRAALVPHLDVETAADRLGDDVVVLLRGHRFHARAGGRGTHSARLVDVTDYPEVNHLVLASDAAVLDYSSLRFDFSLTGRPMVFLVPDLDRYRGGRGFLFPFEESAPGPLVSTTDEVVNALQDLPAVAARYAEEYAAFQRRFNYLQDGRAAERVAARFFG
ncbi:MAG: CDP-glycerol glycerophosphotransferase [Nocardioidaceae bacterium]|nr:CDP-glycerol glycerophosphotransferase [Nocardioidaceae bacterium]